jgi:hypothetical protein
MKTIASGQTSAGAEGGSGRERAISQAGAILRCRRDVTQGSAVVALRGVWAGSRDRLTWSLFAK